ncbi:uncharacterized protein A4U43_C03F14840 [Asparagus officinalis]|uniref:Late embryogenesis abundant protein LEA-2 subgroup domain-containing protein n=1 Tax=Asparagus officinalis TaxID=4686 RepID=A0A5P1FAP8_ASPOF|nr:uncharacterized protein LOC109833717 [Asparagus officinalis]ONK75242.1 uncharacterized protein A4U43_C03F14840 [Asparagus officinalis]
MSSSSKEPQLSNPLLAQSQNPTYGIPIQEPPQTYILLPYLRRRRLFPSDPAVSLSRLHLRHLSVSSHPNPKLDINLALTVKIRNRDFFSLDYNSIVVSIGYRGRRLGFVTSDGGKIRARGVSYVDAELDLDGIRVIKDAFYLIEDILKGSIPFETVTEVDGRLHVLFFDIPVDGRISCSVYVNPDNQTVVRQDCYPE